VTPDWAAQLREQLRVREANLAIERRLAARAPSEEMTARVARDAQLVERDRAAALAQVEQAVASERSRSASLANASHCTDGGLHVDGTNVFAVWCCP
jgi:hypothetical protein